MVAVRRKKRCSHQGCQQLPSFGEYEIDKTGFCAEHATKGMVNMTQKCSYQQCMAQPLAGAVSDGSSMAYSVEHVFKGLTSMRCENMSSRKRIGDAAWLRTVGAPPNDNGTHKRKGSGAPISPAGCSEGGPVLKHTRKRARRGSASIASVQGGQ